MNELIKRLAKNAGYSGDFNDPEEIEVIGNDFAYFDIEKFAGSVVQECLALTLGEERMQALEQGDLRQADRTQKKIIQVIKHFGDAE
jgi:hypothetical protein